MRFVLAALFIIVGWRESRIRIAVSGLIVVVLIGSGSGWLAVVRGR